MIFFKLNKNKRSTCFFSLNINMSAVGADLDAVIKNLGRMGVSNKKSDMGHLVSKFKEMNMGPRNKVNMGSRKIGKRKRTPVKTPSPKFKSPSPLGNHMVSEGLGRTHPEIYFESDDDVVRVTFEYTTKLFYATPVRFHINVEEKNVYDKIVYENAAAIGKPRPFKYLYQWNDVMYFKLGRKLYTWLPHRNTRNEDAGTPVLTSAWSEHEFIRQINLKEKPDQRARRQAAFKKQLREEAFQEQLRKLSESNEKYEQRRANRQSIYDERDRKNNENDDRDSPGYEEWLRNDERLQREKRKRELFAPPDEDDESDEESD